MRGSRNYERAFFRHFSERQDSSSIELCLDDSENRKLVVRQSPADKNISTEAEDP
jgi:hypothetical protein